MLNISIITLKTLTICEYFYLSLTISSGIITLPNNKMHKQWKLKNETIALIVTTSILVILSLDAVSNVSTLSASTYEADKPAILGYAYASTYEADKPAILGYAYSHPNPFPMYRYQNWDTHTFSYISNSLSPSFIADAATKFPPSFPVNLWHISFQTIGWYSPDPFPARPDPLRDPRENQVLLYEYLKTDNADRAFSTKKFDPSFISKGYTSLGEKSLRIFSKQVEGTVPIYSYLIDGRIHFYSIHSTEIEALGHVKR